MTLTLVLNAGSSTLKYTLFEGAGPESLLSDTIEITDDPQAFHQAVAHIVARLTDDPALPDPADITAVGHRVVHGGVDFNRPVRISADVKDTIHRLSDLAPLHNPPALSAIQAAEQTLPDIPHVAVFDTTFFAGLPPAAHVYPVPYEWYTDRGIRRFGFHGISHAYCAHRAAELLVRPLADLRLVVAHLGNGCSASAIQGGVPVATTMGFTPLEGLMMGTRSGSIDPGILLYLLSQDRMTPDQLDTALNRESGLLGVSGVSSDMRQVLSAAQSGDDRAVLAVDLFVDRARSATASLTAAMGGLDALVFTAGIGENAPEIRQRICRNLSFVGCHLDEDQNTAQTPDADLATPDSPVRIFAIHTREDLQIAREVHTLLSA